MILIAVRDYGISARVSGCVSGNGEVASAFDVQTLLRLTRTYKPRLIILGARLGGTSERVVERIPQLLRISPAASLIVMTYSPTEEEADELKGFGAFGYVDADEPRMELDLDRLIRRALDDGISRRTRIRRRQIH